MAARISSLPGRNFGKYLTAADGTPLEFFSSTTSPNDEDLVAALQAPLKL